MMVLDSEQESKEEEGYICNDCGKHIKSDDRSYVIADRNYIVCNLCIANYHVCGDCNQWVKEVVNLRGLSNPICNDCKERYSLCHGCGYWFYEEDFNFCEVTQDSRCNNCYCYEDEDSDNDNCFRVIKLPFEKLPSNTFNINKYKSFCGVEIECINNDLRNNTFNSDQLKKYGFSQIEDGSLSNGGIEYPSIAFNGDIAFNKINEFCSALKKNHFYINSDCGLHIHIEVKKNIDFIKKVFLFYSRFEDFYFKMLPTSRQNNNYCKKIKEMYSNIDNDLFSIEKMQEFKEHLYCCKNRKIISYHSKDKYHQKRYSWLNVHSIFYRGTLEIRNHAGTIDADKINNWLKIHLTTLDFIKGLSIDVIKNLPLNIEFFLSIFDNKLRQYILNRIKKFNPDFFMDNDSKIKLKAINNLCLLTNGDF